MIKNFKLSLSNMRELIKLITDLISKEPAANWFVNVSKKERKRSLPANSVYYAWLPDISDHMGLLIPEARNYLKLNFGLSVLFSGEVSDKATELLFSLEKSGFWSWTYDEQMREMSQRNITSIMTTKEHNLMRDQVIHFFGVQGLNLDYK